MKAPPEDPKNIGILQPQAGYSTDVHVETHTYSDKPTPINPNDNKTKQYVNEHLDSEHRKKYAKEGGKKLFDMLFAFVCR
ncbi:hypothetical protein Cantr_08476 [Candida viswanathii]|uniref:Uncharacterized protein n=1 Tax=Candida viswanathii TaxID=5486 RepID=A0A367Y4N1_9ASCO|nr:hypothetical protein Cantr_08476 [Candida viswanathii]